MLSFLKMSFLVLTCAAFVACNSKEKDKKDAEDVVAQYNALVRDLNNSTPSVSWTEEDLDEYEQKLDRLEQLEYAVDAADAKDGIIIMGGNNSLFVSQRRNLIHRIREKKQKAQDAQATDSQTTDSDTTQQSQLISEINELSQETMDLDEERMDLGDLTIHTKTTRLLNYKNLTIQMIRNCDKLLKKANQLTSSTKQTSLILSLSDLRHSLENELADVESLLAQKMADHR